MSMKTLFHAVLIAIGLACFEIVVIMSAIVFFVIVGWQAATLLSLPTQAADYDFYAPQPPVVVEPPPLVVVPTAPVVVEPKSNWTDGLRCRVEREVTRDDDGDVSGSTEREICD